MFVINGSMNRFVQFLYCKFIKNILSNFVWQVFMVVLWLFVYILLFDIWINKLLIGMLDVGRQVENNLLLCYMAIGIWIAEMAGKNFV